MPAVDVVVETAISNSVRARQLRAMFDVPVEKKCTLQWQGDLPIEQEDWNVGLIVGPSGSGKTTVARSTFGENFHPDMEWRAASVIDDFAAGSSMESISKACQAVGFNTIPAWLRPHSVLSNGEKFRVELARRVLELPDPVIVDEFTSVVDRQVAQIGAYAVAKWVRREKRKFVAVTCHYDVIEWLQPDWILEPATMKFTARRGLQRSRPGIDVEIGRVGYEAWRLFAPFHYLSADLNKSARCYGLFANGTLAAFAGVLPRPHPKVKDIRGVSRLVTLPDWQGLGLAPILADSLGAAYRAAGYRLRTYPAHPALIRSFDKSEKWKMVKEPGVFSPPTGNQKLKRQGIENGIGSMGGRPCAVFEYSAAANPEAKELVTQ